MEKEDFIQINMQMNQDLSHSLMILMETWEDLDNFLILICLVVTKEVSAAFKILAIQISASEISLLKEQSKYLKISLQLNSKSKNFYYFIYN